MASPLDKKVEISTEADFSSFDDYFEAIGQLAYETVELIDELEEDERVTVDNEYKHTLETVLSNFIAEFYDEEVGRKPTGDEVHRFYIKSLEATDEMKKLYQSGAAEELFDLPEDYRKVLER